MIQTSLPHPAPSPFAAVDPKRIAANAAVIAVHGVVLMFLMLPSSWTPSDAPARDEAPILVDWRDPPPPIVPIPPPPLPIVPPVVRPTPRPVMTPQATEVPVTEAPLFDDGEEFALPAEDAPPVTSFDPGPQLATLAYDVYPAPRYPRNAIRIGAEGVVTLRVLVDEQGRPIDVVVEKSSGNRDLDRAAREQVLARWRFHPAQQDGRAVRAYALVPIGFTLP